jgi:hypothetical protein
MRAANAVAAIGNEVRLDPRCRHRPMHDRVIDAMDIVRAKLRGQQALGRRGPCQHEEPARLAVEPMHDAERAVGAPLFHAAQRGPGVLSERVVVARLVGDAQHAGRLVDDDDIAIGEHDGLLRRRPGRTFRPSRSTTTVAPGGTRDAGSRQRSPSTVTRPSAHSERARDHGTPVCSRTTAATVGSSVVMWTRRAIRQAARILHLAARNGTTRARHRGLPGSAGHR